MTVYVNNEETVVMRFVSLCSPFENAISLQNHLYFFRDMFGQDCVSRSKTGNTLSVTVDGKSANVSLDTRASIHSF